MANPQKENGNTQIANEILEALLQTDINGTDLKCILFILRKTYGWNKKEDEISLTQFTENINASIQAICKALNKLTVNKIIVVNKDGYINKYGLNKDYSQWILNKITVNKITVNKKNTDTKQNDKKLLNKITVTKDIIQKTITKDMSQIEFSDEVKQLSDFLYELIKQNNPNFQGNPRKWDSAFDKVLRIDKRPYGEVSKLIQCVQEDDFWRSNILSGQKLREKYDQLIMKMSTKKSNLVFIS